MAPELSMEPLQIGMPYLRVHFARSVRPLLDLHHEVVIFGVTRDEQLAVCEHGQIRG